MGRHLDEIATGQPTRPKLRIAGRPKPGRTEKYVLLEEPDEPVQMHWKGRLVPHLKSNCEHCDGTNDPKPMWYVGAIEVGSGFVIVEFTWKCFCSCEAAARKLTGGGLDLFGESSAPRFTGLLITISRPDFASSPRVLRCEHRSQTFPEWPYWTRGELGRIWGYSVRPRIYKEGSA